MKVQYRIDVLHSKKFLFPWTNAAMKLFSHNTICNGQWTMGFLCGAKMILRLFQAREMRQIGNFRHESVNNQLSLEQDLAYFPSFQGSPILSLLGN